MSIRSKIVKAFMHGLDVKGKLATKSAGELHEYSVPEPPESVRNKYHCQKIEVEEAKGYWISKEKAANGVLVYLHGGAYIVGPVGAQWNYIAKMSEKANKAAVVIDYRQLPDFPFPHGLNDVMTIITHLQNKGELPENWILMGDSAGGALALAATYQLREREAPLPKKLVLMSPWLDFSMTNPALKRTEKDDPYLSLDMENAVKGYVPEEEAKNPLVSPLYGKLEGLPPMLLQTGTSEILLWDARKFYLKCLDTKVNIQYEEYPDMFHVFMIVGILPEAKKAQQSQLDFMAS